MSQTEVQLIKDAVIVNADISNSAAIDVSKLSGVMPLAGGTFTGDILFQSDSGNILFDKSDNALEFSDNNKAKFGGSGDLEIFHDGSHSNINNSTGNLRLQCDAFRINSQDNNESIFRADKDGSVELYHDNSKKFETTSSGVAVTGNVEPTGNINVVDSSSGSVGRARFGNGADLQIYHDGSHSVLNNFTGSLQVQDAGAEKFRVSGTGTSFKDDIFLANDNDKLNFGAGSDLQIYSNGLAGIIDHVTTGSGADLILRSKTIVLRNLSDENMIVGNQNGSVNLYFDNTLKFQTTTDGAAVSNISNNKGLDLNGVGNNTGIRFMSTGSSPGHAYRINYHSVTNNIFNSPCISFDKTDTSGTFDSHIGAISDDGFHLADNKKLHLGGTGANGDLQIFHDGSNSRISDNGTGNLILDGNEVVVQSNDNSETQARFITNGAVELYHNNVKSARTINTGSNGLLVGDDEFINASINHGELIVRKDLGSPNEPSITQCARITIITNEQTAGGNGYGGALFFGGQDVDASNQYTADLAAIGATTNGSDIGNSSASGFLDFYTRNGGAFGHKFRIEPDGDLLGTDTSIGSLSDSRLKENIEDFTYDINKFKQFKPKTFNWKHPEYHRDTPASGKHRGFVAQDLESIDSELVSTYRIPKDNPEGALVDQVTLEENELKDVVSEGKTANLGRIDAMYISVINQLITKVETLETKVAALEAA